MLSHMGVARQFLPTTARQSFLIGTAVGALLGLLVLPALSQATGVDSGFGGGVHDGYIELARNLARGNGYVFAPDGDPVGHRPPLYPMLLAPMTLLPSFMVRGTLVACHAILIGLTAALTFRIATRLYDRDVACAAVCIFLANPWVYWVARNPMSPIFEMFLYAWFFDVLVVEAGWASTNGRSDGSPTFAISPFRTLKLGLIAGALLLTHGAMLLTIALLMGIAVVTAILRRPRGRILALGAAGLIGVLCLGPWTVRNWVTLHRFVPVATNAGYAYFLGNAHWGLGDAPGGPWPSDRERALALAGVSLEVKQAEHFYGIRDPELDAYLAERMKEDILAHPYHLVVKVVLNGLEYYFPIVHPWFSPVPSGVPTTAWGNVGKLVRSLYYAGLWSLALLGAVWWWRHQGVRAPALLGLAIAAFALPFFPFLAFCAHNHYAFGTLPFLSIGSGVGVRAILPRGRSDRAGAQVVPPNVPELRSIDRNESVRGEVDDL